MEESMNVEQCKQYIIDKNLVCGRCGGELQPYNLHRPNEQIPYCFNGECSSTTQNLRTTVRRDVYAISEYMVRVRWFTPLRGAGLRPIEVSPAHEPWIWSQIEACHQYVSAIITKAVQNNFVKMPATGEPLLKYATVVCPTEECFAVRMTMEDGVYVPVDVLHNGFWTGFDGFIEVNGFDNHRIVDKRLTILPDGYPDCDYPPRTI